MRVALFIVALCVLICGAAAAETPIQYVTGPSTLACIGPYFDDAIAAWRAGDAKWLQSTGCVITGAGVKFIIIIGHSTDTADSQWSRAGET